MDLRYLDFLFAAYSWIVIAFCAVLLLWLLSAQITEITIVSVKVKTAITFRSLFSVLVIAIGFTMAINFIQTTITYETDHARQASFAQDNAKEQWKQLFEQMTHSASTAAFAFLRYEGKPLRDAPMFGQAGQSTDRLSDSVVQDLLWVLVMFLPPILLSIELGSLGLLFSLDGEAIAYLLFIAFFTLIWVFSVRHGYHEIRDTVLEVAQLAA